MKPVKAVVKVAADPGDAPGRDCPLCPRLVAFRTANRRAHPDWHNGPVPAFGPLAARLLIVGLAPGLRGANRTGRPFTGDFAGQLLYPTLLKFGLARGAYGERPDDGLALVGTRISNAVRCVPPQNKPDTVEIRTCNVFLTREIAAMANLEAILALGAIAHNAVLAALAQKRASFPFAHGATHKLSNGLLLTDSYHCSRLNTNTGRLTTRMFEDVVKGLKARVD
jgi:uracil-DNA glycosylase family 4